jgi:YbbR domain-containing protein
VMSLPGFLTRNWTLKLSAFGIALLLWISVRVEAPNAQTLDGVPVRVDVADPRWALVDDPSPTGVTVRFRGPSRELLRMTVDRPSIVIPLNQVSSGDTTIALQRQWVRLQDRPGVTVEDIQPGTVTLQLESVMRVELPAALRFEGELDEDWAFTHRPSPVPAELVVSGPESRVLQLDSIPMRPVNLAAVNGTARQTVQVDTSSVRGIYVQPGQVEVELRVAERVTQLERGVPIILGVPGWEEIYELEPGEGEVLVSGAQSVLDGLDPGLLRLYVVLDEGVLPQEPGEEATFPLAVQGLPDLVRGTSETDEVLIRRREPPEPPQADDDPDPPADPPLAGGGR